MVNEFVTTTGSNDYVIPPEQVEGILGYYNGLSLDVLFTESNSDECTIELIEGEPIPLVKSSEDPLNAFDILANTLHRVVFVDGVFRISGSSGASTGGGGETFAQTLALGNSTGANDISVLTGRKITSTGSGNTANIIFLDGVMQHETSDGAGHGVNFAMTPDGLVEISGNSAGDVWEGLKYGADFSAYFTDRSMVDKGYVDSGLSSQTIAQVLTNGDDANDQDILNLGYILNTNGSDETTVTHVAGYWGASAQNTVGFGKQVYSEFDANNSQMYFESAEFGALAEDANLTSLLISKNSFVIGDNTSKVVSLFPGAQYIRDYSSNYTSRSLVDKGYVDGVASGYLQLAGGTMSGDILFVSGFGIDTTATGGTDVMNIGANNANVINYGNSSTTHNFLGVAIYETQINSYVTDKLITLNKGGSAASGIGVGFEIDEANTITGHIKTNSARSGYVFMAPSNGTYHYNFILNGASADRDITFQNTSGTVYVSTGTDVTLADGGTGASLVASNGGIFYSTATEGAILAGTATAGQMLRSGSSAAPSWSTNTWANTTAANQILFATSANVIGGATTFLTDGAYLILGGTAVLGTEFVSYQKSQNANSQLAVANITNGTASSAEVIVSSNSTNSSGLRFFSFPSLYTSSGIKVASAGVVLSDKLSGLNVGTTLATQFSMWTDDTERARFLSTGEFLVGGTSLVSAETLSVQKNQNAITQFLLSNTTSGTAGRSAISAVITGIAGISMQVLSAGYTTSGILVANTAVLNTGMANGMNVGCTNAAASLKFWTTSLERGRFLESGEFLVGGTSVIGTEFVSIQKNSNANTVVTVSNTTNGTAGATGVYLRSSGNQGGIWSTSAAFTTSGIYTPDSLIFEADSNATRMNIGTRGASPLTFWSNDTEAGRFISTGEFLVGATAVFSVEKMLIREDANSNTFLRVHNATAGTAAISGILVSNAVGNSGSGLYNISASYTTSGILEAGNVVLLSGSGITAGMNLGTVGNAPLKFWTNNTDRGRVLSSGEFIWGGTALISTELVSFQRNANSANILRVHNTTAGTASRAQVSTVTDGGSISMIANSTTFTNSGIDLADTGRIASTNMDFHVGTTTSNVLSFWTNAVQRWSITAAGILTAVDAMDMAFGTGTGTKIATATSQKISFWNATPIVQPTTGVAAATLASNGGTTLTDTDTFDGYTLKQIVKALRNIGLLA